MESVFLNGGMIGATLDFGSTDQYVIGTTTGFATLEYVGGLTSAFAGTTSNTSVTISGITMQEGDIVIVTFATGSSVDRAITASTYTQIAKLYTNDTNDTNLYVGYKFMGSTPDTNIVFTGGTLNASDAGTVAVHVWRNVDATTPLDVTPTTSTTINTIFPTPPAITPVTSGAVIIAAYAGAHSNGSASFATSNGLDNFLTRGSNDTYDSVIGMGSYNWTSGSYTPPVPSGGVTNNSGFSSAAVTLALRPATIEVPVYGNYKNSGIWNLPAVFDVLSAAYVAPIAYWALVYNNASWTDSVVIDANSNSYLTTAYQSPIVDNVIKIAPNGSIQFCKQAPRYNETNKLAMGSDLYMISVNQGFVFKFSTSGTLLSEMYFTDGSPRAISSDSANNLYINNFNNTSGVPEVFKMDSSGSFVWGSALTTTVTCESICAAESGNVYAGFSYNGDSIQLIKYNFAGFVQWQRRIVATGLIIYPSNLFVDSSENLYVVGLRYDIDFNQTYYIAKYDASGTIQWQRIFTGIDYNASAVDSSGNIYLASADALTTLSAYIVKYDTAGNIVWQRKFNYLTPAIPDNFPNFRQMAVDSNGDLVISGEVIENDGVTQNGFAIKYPGDGSIIGTFGLWGISDNSGGTSSTPSYVSSTTSVTATTISPLPTITPNVETFGDTTKTVVLNNF